MSESIPVRRRLRHAAVAVLLLLATLPWRAAAAEATAVTLPPGPRPVEVRIGFFLLHLVSVDERSETFDADLYLGVSWHDPRLAFTPEPGEEALRTWQDAGAEEKIEEIWWPNLEFVNTSEPEITNRVLRIHSDGRVEYDLGVSATFRTDLDLRHFPFDQQTLSVLFQSFEGTAAEVRLVADAHRLGYTPGEEFDGLRVDGVAAESRLRSITGWGREYDELAFEVHVQREAGFYLWTIFVPLTLILILFSTIFFVEIENFHDRIGIALACFLACIATQFAMSFNLPRISYLTPIDRLFLATYACMVLGVGISVWQKARLSHDRARLRRVDRVGSLAIPLLYVALVTLIVMP